MLSKLCEKFPFLMRFARYRKYESIPEWDGYYELFSRCIAFRDNIGTIVWLHEVL